MSEFKTDGSPSAGGLSQAISPQPQPSPQQAQSLPAAPAPQPSEYEKALAENQKQKQELLSQQQRLVQFLEQRVASPQDLLWRLAGAFAAPTRGGSFGESFGNAVQAMGQHSEQQRQQMSDIAKMRAEMAAQQLGMSKENLELARTREAAKGLQQIISGSSVQSGDMSSIPPEVAASIQNRLAFNDVKGAQDLYDKYIIELNKLKAAQTQSEFSTPYGTFKMTQMEYNSFLDANAKGKGREWIQKFRYGTSGSAPSTAAAGAPVAGATATPPGI